MKRLFLASEINVSVKHILKQIPINNPKTAFITTAGETEPNSEKWISINRNGMVGFECFNYTITNKSLDEIKNDLSDIDILHVNGGNTFYLLLQSRKTGFDQFVKEFVENGGIYTGSSAGSIILSPDIGPTKIIDKDTFESELETFEGFNLVDFLVFPHWGREEFRADYRLERLSNIYMEENKIILLNDYQYVRVEDDMYKIVDVRETK